MKTNTTLAPGVKITLMFSVSILLIIFQGTEAISAPLSGNNFLDDITTNFLTVCLGYGVVVKKYALNLFFTLVLLDLIWGVVQLMLKTNSADITDWPVLIFQKIMFFGFFYLLLDKGLDIAMMILEVFTGTIAGAVIATNSGVAINNVSSLKATDIMDMGFQMGFAMLDNVGWFSADGISVMITVIIMEVLIIFIVAEIVVTEIEFYLTATLGYFFLALGGAGMTRDHVWNYFRTVAGIAVKLFAIYMICAVEFGFIQQWIGTEAQTEALSKNKQSCLVMIAALMLFAILVKSVPDKIVSIIATSIGGGGGAAANTSMGKMAGAAAGTATAAAGGAMALKAAHDLTSTQSGSGGSGGGIAGSLGVSKGVTDFFSGGGESSGSGGSGIPTLNSVGSAVKSAGAAVATGGAGAVAGKIGAATGKMAKHVGGMGKNLASSGAKTLGDRITSKSDNNTFPGGMRNHMQNEKSGIEAKTESDNFKSSLDGKGYTPPTVEDVANNISENEGGSVSNGKPS